MGSSTLLLFKTKTKNEVMTTFFIIVYLFSEKKESIQFSMKLQSSSLLTWSTIFLKWEDTKLQKLLIYIFFAGVGLYLEIQNKEIETLFAQFLWKICIKWQ
jgi:hypothetical protein